MSEGRVERRLAAILAADVVGYSRLMGQDEAGTLARLRALRRDLIDPRIADHKGRVVKTTGDGILIEFPSVVEAVDCAVSVQREMAEHNVSISQDQRIEFRVGINSGDVIVDGDDIHGDGVNVAARLEALADPGGICISGIVHDQVQGRLEVGFEDTGEQRLKNIARAVVYRVGLDENAATTAVPKTLALPLPDRPSIAVLPFQNMSGDPEQEYFADGMVEEIITALSRIRWLFVIARNSSFAYKGQAIDVKRVGRELGVRYVLEGSVRRGGSRVRVTAQLIDAIGGAHVWAERYDRDLSDIFVVQDEITASVAGTIEPALFAAEQERILRKPPDRLDAWEAYQRGMWHFYKYGAEDNKIAQAFFRQAISADPNFAPGHYGLALALWFDFWLYLPRTATDALETGLEEARIAVALDEKDSMGRSVLAAAMGALGQWDSAITEARAGLALNPNSAFAMAILGGALMLGGDLHEGIESLRRAIRVSPYDPLTWFHNYIIGSCQFRLEEFQAALDSNREVIRLRPQHAMAHMFIAASLAYLGRADEARQKFDLVRAQFPDQLARARIRPPWWKPEAHERLMKGLRLAAGESG